MGRDLLALSRGKAATKKEKKKKKAPVFGSFKKLKCQDLGLLWQAGGGGRWREGGNEGEERQREGGNEGGRMGGRDRGRKGMRMGGKEGGSGKAAIAKGLG